jgi:argininosuccinate lyase
VSDRDGAIEFLAAAGILMMHLSRFCEELVLWSTDEFGYLELPDAFCTGSSLMPQKKNPDVPELIRAKTGRVYGHLMALLTVMKGLPLAYNRDLQEDKEAVFDSVDTVRNSLSVLTEMIRGITVRREAAAKAAESGFLLATEAADYLVEKGLPFRQAHEVVGRIVRYCLDQGRDLTQLSIKELQKFSGQFQKDVIGYLDLEASVERKQQTGATARNRILERIRRIEEK